MVNTKGKEDERYLHIIIVHTVTAPEPSPPESYSRGEKS